MNFRKQAAPNVLGFQIAPMVDIFLVLLIFFIMTWNVAVHENSLDVKVPVAANADEQEPYVNRVVINVKSDGDIILNKQTLSREQLLEKLSTLSELYPDHAVIIRGDRHAYHESITAVLDICKKAKIYNIDFATASQP